METMLRVDERARPGHALAPTIPLESDDAAGRDRLGAAADGLPSRSVARALLTSLVLPVLLLVVRPATLCSQGAALPGDTPDVAALRPFTGVYLAGSQHRIVLSIRRIEGRAGLLMTDLRDGSLRALAPAGEDVFVAGDELIRPDPPLFRLAIERDEAGVPAALVRTHLPSGSLVRAVRRAERVVPVEIVRAGLTLSGEVHLPPGLQSGRPGVVYAAGSEDSDRFTADVLPHVLADLGVATLVFDKRGTGASEGDWQACGLEDLAGDLLEAVHALASRPEVDAGRVGIVGFSEGGWTAPLAAAREPGAVAFLVTVNGGAFTKGDSYLYKTRRVLEEQGLSGDELEAGLAQARALIAASAARVRAGEGASGFDRRVSLDPADAWRSFRGPVLSLGGEWDVLEDARASAERLRTILGEAGNADATVLVLPKTLHGMFLGTDGTPSEFFRLRGIAGYTPGYWDILLRWLDRRALR
jgi:pimeloyl-ACP methyl ester carboxylesterase